ncbi:hypothetical protein C8Q73DRAFT_201128 [Cubamyces lactineus]|nr:hypothetical protein C8Q73DRAFT_201128 [Cubamyces lactineus]
MLIVPLVCIRPLLCECLSTYCETPTTHIRFADFHACTTPMTPISACFRSPVYPYIRTDPPNVYIRLPLRISVYTRPPFYPFRCPAPAPPRHQHNCRAKSYGSPVGVIYDS